MVVRAMETRERRNGTAAAAPPEPRRGLPADRTEAAVLALVALPRLAGGWEAQAR